jgi:LDH2 family malate/lactate/ureidoglycolate dehydrogenase
MSEDVMKYVETNSLREYCISLLEKVGVPREEGFYMADGLVLANLRGVDSHGVSRMPIYMKSFSLGLIRPVAEMEILNEAPASMLVDAKNSIGAVIGVRVMEKVIEKAREAGIAMASVCHSTHFGMSCYYSMMALPENMIGFAISNSPPAMAPWGGKEPFTGTNPLSFAIPTGREKPIVIDMATSVVAKGKIILALKKDGIIPEGWALNKDGEMTTSAQEAMAGTVCPMGGPKGYALSLLVDIMCGVLSGGAYGPNVKNLYKTFDAPQDICHCFGAINIEKFIPLEQFKATIDKEIHEIKTAPKAKNTKEIFLPGEIEINMQEKRLKEGIPMPLPVFEELMELSRMYDVPFAVVHSDIPFQQ